MIELEPILTLSSMTQLTPMDRALANLDVFANCSDLMLYLRAWITQLMARIENAQYLA